MVRNYGWRRLGKCALTNKILHLFREGVVFRYSESVDAATIRMARPAPGLIAQTWPLDHEEVDVFMDVDSEDRIIAIEFLDASTVFACHFFDDARSIDDKQYAPPLTGTFFFLKLISASRARPQTFAHDVRL
jgi:uncharacterized protein YuzE